MRLLALLTLTASLIPAAGNTQTETESEKQWTPTPFDLSTRLPERFSGTDPLRFYRLFAEKMRALKKGQFETTEEFNRRTADKDLLLQPLSIRSLYAFRVSNVKFRYDADKQVFLVSVPKILT